MTECGCGSVTAHPASGSFCTTQVNLTMPNKAIAELQSVTRAIGRCDLPLNRLRGF
jgi:hypothetical protein